MSIIKFTLSALFLGGGYTLVKWASQVQEREFLEAITRQPAVFLAQETNISEEWIQKDLIRKIKGEIADFIQSFPMTMTCRITQRDIQNFDYEIQLQLVNDESTVDKVFTGTFTRDDLPSDIRMIFLRDNDEVVELALF